MPRPSMRSSGFSSQVSFFPSHATPLAKAGSFFTLRFNGEIRAWLTDENARGGWSGRGWSGGHAEWIGSVVSSDSPFNTPWRREKGGLWDVGPHALSVLLAVLGDVLQSR